MNKTMITEHFSLEEMTRSNMLTLYNKSHRPKVTNTPDDAALSNLKSLCSTLEKIRAAYGKPMVVSSGYRTKFVNDLVGGSAKSLHLYGLAADIIVPMDDMPAIMMFAMNLPEVQELLMSYSGRSYWLHIGISDEPLLSCRFGIDFYRKVKYVLHHKVSI